MNYNIKIQPEAEEDVNIAYEWYESQKVDLGRLFLNELRLIYEKIENNPLTFSKTGKHYRQAILHRFPYVIIYEIVAMQIIIYAVFHTSRNPKQVSSRK